MDDDPTLALGTSVSLSLLQVLGSSDLTPLFSYMVDGTATFISRGAAADIWLYVIRLVISGSYLLELDNQEFCSKAERWNALQHPNVIKVFGLGPRPDLSVEFCENGTASQIQHILEGVKYLHTQDPAIIHGSLRADKIFVTADGTAKVGEFGLSFSIRNFALLAPSVSQAGLSRWMSPELVNIDPDVGIVVLTTASDVWALGCTLMEILSGATPYGRYKHELRVRRAIIQGESPGSIDPSLEYGFSSISPILEQCWALSPGIRPTASEVQRNIHRLDNFAVGDEIAYREDESMQLLGHTPSSPSRLMELSPWEYPIAMHHQPDGHNYIISSQHQGQPQPLIFSGQQYGLSDQQASNKTANNTALDDTTLTTEMKKQTGEKETVGTIRASFEQQAAQNEEEEDIFQGPPKTPPPPQYNPDSVEIRYRAEPGPQSLMAFVTPKGTSTPDSATEEERSPTGSPLFGSLADFALANWERESEDTSTGRRSTLRDKDKGDREIGTSNAMYFKPDPTTHPALRRILVERQMVPEILASAVVTDEEVEHLFWIFHERIDAFIGIIDPTIHTVAGVKARCSFLFTVTSQYWVERPELYTVLMHHAKSAAGAAFADAWRSLEVCQAYLLLSLYPQPARSREEDRRWLYLGGAIRLAMDLNLYEQGTTTFISEAHEREVLNRTRTWLLCFNLDYAFALKLNRPATVPEDGIVRRSREWWHQSRYNGRLDVHLCFHTQLLRIVKRYLSLMHSDPESLSGFNENTESGIITHAAEFSNETEQFRQDAEYAYHIAPDAEHPACQYRLALTSLAVAYYRFVMYCSWLEHANRSSMESRNMLLAQSIDTASEVLRITNDELSIYEFHVYSPDGHWMWGVSAAEFLIKVGTTLAPLTMTPVQREASMTHVRKLIIVLEHSVVNPHHSPALYASYLKEALGEPRTVHAQSSRPQPTTLAQKSAARSLRLSAPPPESSGLVPPRTAASPGPSEPKPGKDTFTATHSPGEDFRHNTLSPGTWGTWGTVGNEIGTSDSR
ncbi:hypothetical protein FRC07_012764 [Ceratobasidium sp. 392]|nr:hypothetical protein FRC07_012764 [Ceratobasidium sp. 392]